MTAEINSLKKARGSTATPKPAKQKASGKTQANKKAQPKKTKEPKKDKRKVGMEEQAPQGYRWQRKQRVCQDLRRQEVLLVPAP